MQREPAFDRMAHWAIVLDGPSLYTFVWPRNHNRSPTMPSHEDIHRRFQELAAQATAIRTSGNPERADAREFYAWVSSSLNLIRSVFGEASPHFARLNAEVTRTQNNFIGHHHLDACRGIFTGAKSDAEGGFIFQLESEISSEVFGDFVALAKAVLSEGHHTVAAVLACAALEDALKRYASRNGLQTDGKTMEDVVNALKGAGLVSGAQKALLGAMPKVRNFAMHADWDKITPQDAGSVIGFVEAFLLAHGH